MKLPAGMNFRIVFALIAVASVAAFAREAQRRASPKTVADRVAEFGSAVDKRLAPQFAAAGIAYPPARMALVGLKDEKRLEVYAASQTGAYKFIRSYPILAASGVAGPKLREGDLQVPEGIYAIELLNPNSRYHLALRVNYPNAADRVRAREEGRTNLGGDIMIHGRAASVGCLAMGDPASEDLFVLAAKTGIINIEVVLAPVDFRVRKFAAPDEAPAWTQELYEQIRAALRKFPVTGNSAN
jgi:hypothetical protein